MQAHSVRRVLAAALAGVLAAAAGAQAQAAVRLPAADRALAAPAAPLFAVGRAEGSDHEIFGRVAHVAFDRADNLYVLDQGRGRIVVFDRQGRFVRQFGRRGRGPGELMAPMRLAIASDGSVVVSDPARGGYLLFSPEGVFRTAVPFGVRGGIAGLEMKTFPTGGVVTVVRQMAGIGGPGAPQTSSRSLLWQRLDGAGAPVTLFRAADAPSAPREGQAPAGSRTSVSSTVVFAPELHFAVMASGALAVAHTEHYRIAVTGREPGQSTARTVERPLQPRRVTEADRQRERELARGGGGMVLISGGHGESGGGLPPAVAQQMGSLQFADVVPVIQGLAADREGRLWVQRAGRAAGEDGPIDLVTEQGQYLGTVTGVGLPAAFGAGRAAWIEEDALGVQRVVVRALPAWR